MKTPISILLLAMATAATLPGAVTIAVTNNVPNGTASSGSGSSAGLLEAKSGSTFWSISSDRGLPVTTYTVSGVDLTSVGGTTSESFTFTVGYTATIDGNASTSISFTGFGNITVGGNNFVDSNETLTATISLTASSFPELSLLGFTKARAGGFPSPTGETGTFTSLSGSATVNAGSTIANVSGNSMTFSGNSTPVISTLNFEGFEAQFSAVPEPAAASLLAVGAIALLRRRRPA